MSDELLAAPRDASWYNRPDVYSPKKMHVAVNVRTVTTALTVTSDESLLGDAACTTPSQMFLDMHSSRSAAEVPPQTRCQRPGCRSRWPEYQPREATR